MDDTYANEITKQAVARACIALGFKNAHKSAIDALADILQYYISTVAVNARDQAEISGRAVAGVQDVFPVLEFTRPKCFNWRELKSFAFEDVKNPQILSNSKWCQPFPYDIPNFPIATQPNLKLDSKNDSNFKDSFVPSHLPAYPPAHTYKKATSSKKRNVNDIYSADVNKQGQSQVKKITSIKNAQNSLSKIEDSIDIGPKISSSTK